MGDGTLPGDTRIGRVRLRVADLERASAFYERTLGLVRLGVDGSVGTNGSTAEPRVRFGASAEGPPLVVIEPAARARTDFGRALGLYHFALLLPDRRSLARALLQLHEHDWPLQGMSDHAVSEAIYLADPDRNGIELYADRPRHAWPRLGDEIRMTTEPLDLRSLLAEAEGAGPAGLPPGTVVGHIHLHVKDLATAERFYAGTLGFDVVTRRYPGALFLSAGGYHHHVAVNTWAGRDAPRGAPDAPGLVDFAVVLPTRDDLERLLDRLRDRGYGAALAEPVAGVGWRIEDPDGNGIVLESG